MIEVTPFDRLGKFRFDWLDATHHFSFGQYYNPRRMGFGSLVVWNDDRIRPRSGFDPHPHRDMEIITYVRQGAITHRDSMGNEGRTGAGDVQVMSAGTGVVHAEYNLEDEETLLFQIWVQPRRTGLEPRWEMGRFPGHDRSGRLVPLASGEPGIDALMIHQDATLYGANLSAGTELEHVLRPGRSAYLVASKGTYAVNGIQAEARDGVAVSEVPSLAIRADDDTELLLFDLP